MEGVAPSSMAIGRLRRPQPRWFLSVMGREGIPPVQLQAGDRLELDQDQESTKSPF